MAVITTMLAAVALPLVWWGDPLGYPAAVLSGATGAVGVSLAIVGAFGPTRVAAAFAFVALGVLLVVSSVARGEADRAAGTGRPRRSGTRRDSAVATPWRSCGASRPPAEPPIRLPTRRSSELT